MDSPRVVSLVPAATEILRHLGVEPVGISHCCANLDTGAPVLTSSIVPDGLSQFEIDRFVSNAAAQGESLYRVNAPLLERLRPDLIVTQGVCDVCAVGSGEVERAVGCLAQPVPTIYLNGVRLDDLFTDMEAIGEAISRDVSVEIANLKTRIENVRRSIAGRTPPRVAVVEWLDPPFLAGHWVPDMVAAAGGDPVGPASGLPSPKTTWEAIAEARADTLLFSFCGYGLDATLADLEGYVLPQAGAAFALDSQYFCALTPKVVRGIEIIAGLLHSDVMPPPGPHEARAWLLEPADSSD